MQHRGVSADSTFTVRLQIRWQNARNATISTTTIAAWTRHTNDRWEEGTRRVVAPAGAVQGEARIVVRDLKGTIYVDDFVVQTPWSGRTSLARAVKQQRPVEIVIFSGPYNGRALTLPLCVIADSGVLAQAVTLRRANVHVLIVVGDAIADPTGIMPLLAEKVWAVRPLVRLCVVPH